MFRPAALAISSLLLSSAQQPPAPVESDPLGRSTPHGCVFGFLKAVGEEDYTRAEEYLDLRDKRTAAPDLARQLQTVLDRGLSRDLSRLNRTVEGDTGDGLPPLRERVGTIETGVGTLDIELDRIQRRQGVPIWLFSARTLRQVPDAVVRVESPEIVRHFPPEFTEIHFLSIPLWRWLLVLVGLVAALAASRLVSRVLIALLRPLLRRLSGGEEQRLASIAGPVRLLFIAVALRVLAQFSPSLLKRQVWFGGAMVVAVIAFAWMAMKFGDIVSDLNTQRLLRAQRSDKLAMIALARRMYKILVAVMAGVVLLRKAGVNVTALLAGLGVGGIALALAAQKTLENVFGGITLIMQEVIRVGDTCHVGGAMGTVEDIGLGTTRFRTFDRTVVSVPNAQLSVQHLENLSMRDKCWFHQVFGLRYDTSTAQLRSILKDIDELLRNNSRVEESTARVRFIGFGTSSLTLEISAYIFEADFAAFLQVQEALLLSILDSIDAAGAAVASPMILRDQQFEPKESGNTAQAQRT